MSEQQQKYGGLHDHSNTAGPLLEAMPGETEFFMAAGLLAQLSDATRLRIFWVLAHSEQCVSDVSVLVGMSTAAVSHHLRGLRQTGLLTSRRAGKEIYYKLAATKEAKLLHAIVDSVFEMGSPCPLCPLCEQNEKL